MLLTSKAPDGLEPLDNSLEMALQEMNERFAFYNSEALSQPVRHSTLTMFGHILPKLSS
jgi:hypothetical protein